MKSKTRKYLDSFIDYRIFPREHLEKITQKNGEFVFNLSRKMIDEDIFSDLIIIDLIFTPLKYRKKGAASILLQDFCSDFKDQVIVLIANPSHVEYVDSEKEKTYEKIKENLKKFYGKRNFIEVPKDFLDIDGAMIYKNSNSLRLTKKTHD